jgi:hypothetical protein
MQEIATLLLRVEARLERLLASGWRDAGAEAADLGREADTLAALGLAQVAERLRAVATAPSATEALPALVLAAAACRLLRARLPAAAAPPGQWADLLDGDPPEPAADQLLPVARLALADGEAWACVRLRGAIPAEWLLLEPLPAGPGEADAAPLPPRSGEAPTASLLSGLAARFRRGNPAAPAAADRPPENGHPWLRRPLRGHLRWLARYPLGAAGKVECCRLEAAEWRTPTEAREEGFSQLRRTLGSGKLEDDQPVFGGGGALRLKLLDAREADVYTWVDGAAATVFRAAARDRAWALAWCQEGLITPLAVIVPGSLFAQPRLVHLVPGGPAEPL